MTNGEFRYLSPLELQSQPGLTMTTSTRPGLPTPGGAARRRDPVRRRAAGVAPGRGPGAFGRPGGGIGGPNTLGPGGPAAGPSAGIAAVVSKSSAASIKVFKNRRQYNQWIVTVQDVMPRSAVGAPQPGQQPGTAGTPGSRTPGRSSGPTT